MKIHRLLFIVVLSLFVSSVTIAQVPKTSGPETKKTQVKKSTPSGTLIDINSASGDQ